MNEHQRLAFGYRQKAVELRAMAADFRDPTSLKRIENLADSYDRLAASEEKLAKEDEVSEKP